MSILNSLKLIKKLLEIKTKFPLQTQDVEIQLSSTSKSQ